MRGQFCGETRGYCESCPPPAATWICCGFPDANGQTAEGKMIFAVGKDFTLTADQLLGLLDRGELQADGVPRLVEGQALG